ncbi:MAG: NUDIX hydrolase [Arachnia sp.]
MPTPQFILDLRQRVGHDQLWLIGTCVVIVREGEHGPEVLLVRRSDTGEWTPVSGITDPGEHPAETAVREAREETGVDIEIDRLVWVNVEPPKRYPNGDRCQFLDHGFVARWVAGEAHVADEESSEVAWFSAGSLPNDDVVLRRRVDAALQPGDGVRFTLSPE